MFVCVCAHAVSLSLACIHHGARAREHTLLTVVLYASDEVAQAPLHDIFKNQRPRICILYLTIQRTFWDGFLAKQPELLTQYCRKPGETQITIHRAILCD